MKKKIFCTLIYATALLGQSDPSKTYNYELTPFASGILTDSKAGLNDDSYLNAGLSLAKNLDDSFIDQIETLYMRSDNLEYKNSQSTNINRFFLNAIKKHELNEKFALYGLAGLGYQDITQELANNEDSPIFNYGIGLRYDIPYYGIALKSDIRHLITTKNSQNDFMYTLGIGMPIGKKYNDEIKAKVPKIEERQVQEKQIVNIPEIKEIDNDQDKDGVINNLDKCPNTTTGVKVNNEGCVDTINLNINFDNNSAEIKDIYNSKVSEFANLLKTNPSMTAVIEAHTDSKGNDSYNLNLSNKRANSVVEALKNYGIESSRLKAIGYGETQPIATNDNETGKAKNRRVTALINK